MSLKTRKYKFQEGDSHDIFELELIPEVVDGVEVYNIEAVVSDSTGIVGKSKKLHYGYLSKEMADFLDQRNEFGFANIERLSLKSPIKYPDEVANLSQKIIIDRHPEAGNTIPRISLDPIKYSDRLEPTITVAIKNFFNVSTADAPLIFKLNDNKLLCDSFYIIDTNDEGTTTIDLNIKNIELNFDSTNTKIDAQTVNFDWWKTPSSNTEHAPSLNFHGENSFAAKNIVVFESNNRFLNSKVISHKTLSFKGMSNAIMDSEISFSNKNQSYSEIKDFISRDSTLADVSGTLAGSINSVKGEDITIKEGGQFNILPANAQETGVSTYLSSLTIEEGSELSIGANGVDKKTISLNNVKVSNGNNIVVFSQDTNINNTQLSGVELSIEKNDSGKFEVSNSTLANKIILKNVSSVNLSEIDSSNLSSSTVVTVENEWIKDRITNVLDEILEKKKKGITFEDNSLILKTDENLELL